METNIVVVTNSLKNGKINASTSIFRVALLLALTLLFLTSTAHAQQLLKPEYYKIIRDNASGELPYADFKQIVQFPGFSPSPGAEQVAEYLSTQARSFGLSDVTIEHFAADGDRYVWAFRSEPSWSVNKAELWLEQPERQLLSDYKVYKGVIGRFSRSASVSAEVIDVGAGTKPEDYSGRSVEGKIVLASGNVSAVTRLAIWEHKAVGILDYRTEDAIDHPDLMSSLQLAPWKGPHGEEPGFAFSLSYRQGMDLKNRIAAGEHVVVHAEVDAETRAGAYPEVLGTIPGTDPSLPVVIVYAHDNSRDTGGANNLTGVGCTLEIARMLSGLISSGKLPRPRRTIRFMWGPEHYGTLNHFHDHPDDLARVLAEINIDMIGYNQDQNGAAAVLHLYRSPFSNPSFIDDVVQTALQKVGEENTISIRNAHFLSHPTVGFLDPIFAPTGSHNELRYNVEPYWGPSDHEDAQTLGVRAILLNDYPDYFLGTQDDSPSAAGDPTQMRRGVVIGATAAYSLASATPADIPAFLQNALTKAEVRLADYESRAYTDIGSATAENLGDSYYDARNVVLQGFANETTALKSLTLVAADQTFDAQAQPFLAALESEKETTLKRVDQDAQARAAELKVSHDKLQAHSADPQFANTIPSRNPDIRGPVNIFRPEYGRWWLVDKTHDDHFEQQLGIAKRGEYAYYEALNLANGKRTVAEIRDILSAEFESMPASEVLQFYKFMEGVGVVQLSSKK